MRHNLAQRLGGKLSLTCPLAAVVLALGAPAGFATQVPGATYSGTTSAGSGITFTVSADGRYVTSYALSGTIPGDICTFSDGSATANPGWPIVNNAFEITFSGTGDSYIKGSFPSTQGAAGTLRRDFGGCDSGVLTWSARTSASPPPATTITSAKIDRKHHQAQFRFKANGKATGFQCALIKKGKQGPRPHFANCKSPKTYRHLKPGKYTFEVRALSRAGTGPVAKRRFTI